MNRRHALSLAAAAMAAGCRRPPAPAAEAPPAGSADPAEAPAEPAAVPQAAPLEGQALVPVKVDPSLEIRRIAGLRPFRPSGFVVRREDHDGKILVHNYGHGGGGMTLSWGSSDLAIRLAGPLAGVACAVIGGGVMGLSTAWLLLNRGAKVTLYTRDLPPDTTSNIAGAQVWPVSVYDSHRRSPEFSAQFVEASRFSFRYFQSLVGPRRGVRWIPNYYLSRNPPENGWLSGPGGVLHDLQIGFRDFGPGEHAFPANHVRRFHTMLIEPAVYLDALLADVRTAGARIVVREFSQAAEILQLPEAVLFNCSGLGAARLFGDPELIPIKGQLGVLMPQPGVDYNLIRGDSYMFPRADGIILGGTYQRGQWDATPGADVAARLLRDHQALFDAMKRSQSLATAP
jgi:glycine/D-amino acid oxidase-like deaminating enzyme